MSISFSSLNTSLVLVITHPVTANQAMTAIQIHLQNKFLITCQPLLTPSSVILLSAKDRATLSNATLYLADGVHRTGSCPASNYIHLDLDLPLMYFMIIIIITITIHMFEVNFSYHTSQPLTPPTHTFSGSCQSQQAPPRSPLSTYQHTIV